MKRFLILYITIATCIGNTTAQEDVLFTNKQLRLNYMNPAYVPEIMNATITLGGRWQWTGLDGAPRTYYAGGKYFFMGAHSQVSLSFMSDEIGYQYTRQPKLSFAFMAPIGDDSYLNLGVGGGLVNRGYDADKINGINTLNAAEYHDIPKGTVPDAEVGFELLLQNFELGASANHLLKGSDEVPLSPLYSGYVNYIFQTSEWWRLAPSYFVYNYKDRWKHQVSLYFYYIFDYEWSPSDLFYVGASYRYEYEGSIMAGINLFSFLSVFYSYDYFFGNLRHGNYGTHEIGLEFKIPQKFQGCFANYGKSRKHTRYTRLR
ncbi:MAG: PorP/SprF family type IX secretion system membrane protein [Paludibacteraceae bacterium]